MNFAENEQWKHSKYLAYTVPIFVTDWRNIKKVEEASFQNFYDVGNEGYIRN